MRNPRVAGFLWPCVAVRGGSVVDDFFWVLYMKVLRRFMWVDFLWNLVKDFRNLGWKTADVVGFVAPLVYLGGGHTDNVWPPRQGVIQDNHLMSLQFFKGLFIRSNVTISFWQPDLNIYSPPIFQGSVQYFLKTWYYNRSHSSFLLSISLQGSLYKAIRSMH